MSHIISLEAQNVKRLRAVHITPKGALITVGGQNEAGKTSVLDSIAMGLGGKDAVPPMPVRKGEEKAKVIITLDNGIVVKRTFTAAGGTNLVITNADGAVYPSPQSLLDKLTGKISFDPLAFLRLEAKAQSETLRKLTGLDFTAQDTQRKTLYETRTAVNRRLDEMRGAVAALPQFPNAPAAEVSSTAILKEIEEVQTANQEAGRLAAAVASAKSRIEFASTTVNQLTASIADLEKRLKEQKAKLATEQGTLAAAKTAHAEALKKADAFIPTDITPLRQQLNQCEETNRQVRANATRAKAIEEGKQKKVEADSLTRKIEAIDNAKAAALAAAKMPVAGLSFADDMVIFDGVPLVQCSGAQRLRISVSIGAALNSQLKVMLIRDGSLLDEQNLEALRQLAEELGLQVWLERVSDGTECSVIISDGAVEGAETPAEPTVAPEPAPTAAAKAKRKTAAKSAAPAEQPVVAGDIPDGSPF